MRSIEGRGDVDTSIQEAGINPKILKPFVAFVWYDAQLNFIFPVISYHIGIALAALQETASLPCRNFY